MNNQLVNFVNFNSTPIMTIRDERTGTVYIPCKPICEAIGVAWQSQLEKIKQDEVLSSVITEIVITANDGKDYKTTCIPLDFLNGWLFKLNPSKVAPEVKDRVIAYQRECYKVLAAHFQGGSPQPLQLEYTPAQRAQVDFDALMSIAERAKVPKSFAVQECAKMATRSSGLDITHLLTQSEDMDNVPDKDVMLEPTELGAHFGLKAKDMNIQLMELGLQVKSGKQWIATPEGEKISERHAWVVAGKSGYNLKWNWLAVSQLMGDVD
jgi:hypothetical protein